MIFALLERRLIQL